MLDNSAPVEDLDKVQLCDVIESGIERLAQEHPDFREQLTDSLDGDGWCNDIKRHIFCGDDGNEGVRVYRTYPHPRASANPSVPNSFCIDNVSLGELLRKLGHSPEKHYLDDGERVVLEDLGGKWLVVFTERLCGDFQVLIVKVCTHFSFLVYKEGTQPGGIFSRTNLEGSLMGGYGNHGIFWTF